MNRYYAFTDEYGAFGWDIDNPTVSTHFIITAIIVEESNLELYTEMAESLRKRHFQTGEIKSKSVGVNHKRRQRILADMQSMPFNIYTVCIDKKKCLENMTSKGLKYKKTFYKFMNNIVHRELRRAFEKVTIVADELIDNDYMQSFCEYVDKHQDMPDLFGDANFKYDNSKYDVRIQVADFISGTLAYVFDNHKKSSSNPNYLKILDDKLISIQLYPKTYDSYVLEESALAQDYDERIAKLCFSQVVKYIEHNKDSEEPEIKAQVIILNHLLFRFMNNDTRGYIYTYELKDQLKGTEYADISDTTFRANVIGKLRDKGIIIASSTKGYKIPSKESEIYDYINHDAKIVIPMLERLKKCRDIIKLSTNNELDLLDHVEYKQLKTYFDNIKD